MAQVVLAPGEFNGEPLSGFGVDPQIVLFQPGTSTAIPLGSDALVTQTVNLGPAVQNDVWLVDQSFIQVGAVDASGQLQVLSVEASLSTAGASPPGFIEGILQNAPVGTSLPKVVGSKLIWSWLFPPTKSEQIANVGSTVAVFFFVWVRNNDGAAAHNVTVNGGVAFRRAQKVVS